MSRRSQRIEALDALRGFALMGILVVNIQVFSGWGFLGDEGRGMLSWSGYDSQLLFGLKILAHDKFYSLFSLLFGYSFVMLARRKGVGSGRYHLRRMLGLLLIGAAHAVFLWPWDILLLYALVGIVLTVFLNRSPGTLLFWALALLALIGLARWYWLVSDSDAWGVQATELLTNNVPRLVDGSYREVLDANLQLLLSVTMDRLVELRPVRVMAMFLLGAAAARLRLAEPDSGHGRLLGWWVVAGLPLALATAVAERLLSSEAPLERIAFVAAETLAGPLTALAYASVLVVWWNRDGTVGRHVRSGLAPAGRMALTNYLAQSAVCVPLFYGFGLGLFADYSLAVLLLFCAALFAAQLIVSGLWLSVFRQGPMEWLWRWQIQGVRPGFVR